MENEGIISITISIEILIFSLTFIPYWVDQKGS